MMTGGSIAGALLVFALIAAGIGLVVALDRTWAVVLGLVVLGMGNGMATLARATVIADLFGPREYGAIAGVAALTTTAARAAGPFAAALYAVGVGYVSLLWSLAAISAVAAVLAYRAERVAQRSQAASSSSASGRT
jgi:MFS family permease